MTMKSWVVLSVCAAMLGSAPAQAAETLYECVQSDKKDRVFKLKVDPEKKILQPGSEGEWYPNYCTRKYQYCRIEGDAIAAWGQEGGIGLTRFKFWFKTLEYYEDMSGSGFSLKFRGQCKKL